MEIKFYNDKGDKNYTISQLWLTSLCNFNESTPDIKEKYWIKNQDCEGMSINSSLIFELLDEHFKKNF